MRLIEIIIIGTIYSFARAGHHDTSIDNGFNCGNLGKAIQVCAQGTCDNRGCKVHYQN